jgi:tetratricopeptide (TPR) repeat protein
MRMRAKSAAAGTLIAAAACAAYANSLTVPFIFDDGPATIGNASIRNLWPLWSALSPPAGTTMGGRPIANLTLAFNYAVSGTNVWSYHALNLLILVLGALTLFGIVRRTLARPVLGGRFAQDSLILALVISLLWTLHPLQTEAITYTVQRVESLMGLFYLLTLYCIVRSVDSEHSLSWKACAAIACLIGMGTKEVMVTAPLLVLLYDRTFLSGSFVKAWRERSGLYFCLAATWLPLGFLVVGAEGSRNGSAGFTRAITPGIYWLTQFDAVAHYLWLSIWPHKLAFDYGTFLVGDPSGALPCALVVVALAMLTLFALLRRPLLGFLGAWFFVILGPTSVVPVATQTMAEHRMYLPLAAVASLAVVGLYSVAGRRCLAPLGILALGLGVITYARNEVYRSERSLWSDTVLERPDNARAHCSLGHVLAAIPGEMPQAISEFEAALRIRPDYADAHTDLGIALEDVPGRLDEAIEHLGEAARLRPDNALVHLNLATALARADRAQEAAPEFEAALRIKPDYFEAVADLGVLLCNEGRTAEGLADLEASLRINPQYARAHFFLGNAMVQTGRIPEGIQHYEEALREEPAFAEASSNLGMILFRIGRAGEGIERIEAAIKMQPNFVQAHFALGAAFMQEGRKVEAIGQYEKVLELRPNDPSAVRMLELIRSLH